MPINDQPLSDIIDAKLKILFIGFNPGLRSAHLGYHYAGKSNRFLKFLYKAGLISQPLEAKDDQKLLSYRYGSVNLVDRPSRGAAELTKEDFSLGRESLLRKLQKYQPWIACYLGVGVYQQFTSQRLIERGLQKSSVISGILDFVISSPSGLNRTPMKQQLERYLELKRLLVQLETIHKPGKLDS